MYIQDKKDAKKEGVDSPDRADSIVMAVHGMVHYLGKLDYTDKPQGMRIERVNKRKPI